MSAINRQHTCAACGMPFTEDDDVNLEPLIDGTIRYIVVHAAHSTSPQNRAAGTMFLRYDALPANL